MIRKTNSKYYKGQALQEIPQNVPFLFWDTCALLDILRIPERFADVTRALTPYQRLCDLIENGNIISITSDMVLYEFNSHFDDILNELSRGVQKVKEDVIRYSHLMSDKKNEKINHILPILDISSLKILENLVRKIWKNTYIIREQTVYRNMAHQRTVAKIPPAKNKGEYKDCFIWATFLQYAEASPSPCKIFITTNTADYCDKATKKIDDALNVECQGIGNASIYLSVGEVYGKLHRDYHL